MTARFGRGRALCTVVALLICAPSLASAEMDSMGECDTWFPDFTCEKGERGRPAGFVMPIAAPYQFEDPFITTGISAQTIWHDFPGNSVFGGGDAWVVALQVRLAITDRLAFIATKDGYTFLNPGNKTVFRNDQGFMDIGAGFKYLAYQSDKVWVTPSLRIDIPVGEDDVLSGNGDGVLLPAVSVALKPWRDLQLIGDLGMRVALDTDEQSSSIFYHLHAAYPLHKYFVPLVELTANHWIDGGDGNLEVDNKLPIPGLTLNTAQAALGTGSFEGADVVNLGSKSVAHNSLLTLAFGFRIPLTDQMSFGAIYEFPITEREDIFDQRVAMTFRYEL